MNIWHEINKDRIKKDDFVAIIEISKNGRNKYELDKETGMLKLSLIHIFCRYSRYKYGMPSS